MKPSQLIRKITEFLKPLPQRLPAAGVSLVGFCLPVFIFLWYPNIITKMQDRIITTLVSAVPLFILLTKPPDHKGSRNWIPPHSG